MSNRRNADAAKRCVSRWLNDGITPCIRADQIAVWPADADTLNCARKIAAGVDRAALKRRIIMAVQIADAAVCTAATSSAQHLTNARQQDPAQQHTKGEPRK